MRYLKKTQQSRILSEGWKYPADHRQIRNSLVAEQHGFCAYSERYICNTDSCDIEHFDSRLKQKSDDSYWKWFAVLHWMNHHKPRKIDPYLPILQPHSDDIADRIKYEHGMFSPVVESDIEAANLVRFLGWNKLEVTEDRARHISRIRDLWGFLSADVQQFRDYLKTHQEQLSFITAIEAEFQLELSECLIICE